MRALSIGSMVLGLTGIASVGVTSPAPPVNKVVHGRTRTRRQTGGRLREMYDRSDHRQVQ